MALITTPVVSTSIVSDSASAVALRMRQMTVAVAVIALVLSSLVVDRAGAQAEPEEAVEAPVTFLQGASDRNLDVYIDGRIAIRNISFGSFSAPLLLDEGKHRIDLREAGAKRRSKRIARISLDITDDRPVTVASYERTNGKLKLYRKAVDTSWVNGESRLVVRHLAKAGKVTMSYDGGPVFRDMQPGRSRKAVVPALPFDIDIVTESNGETVPLLSPVRVTLAQNTVTVLYVVGDFEAGTARAVFHAYRTPLTQQG